jgi:hypothetical protein
MGVGRWRWLLVPVVIVVAGCLPRPTLPPESFLVRVQSTGSSFAVAAPPPGSLTHRRTPVLSMDEVINTAKHAMENDTPVQAIYGTVTCPDATTCSQAFDTNPNPRIDRSKVSAFPVWVVWSLATTGPDVGLWVAYNADTGKVFTGR